MNYKYYLTILISIVIYNKSHAFSVHIHEETISSHVLEIEGFSEKALLQINKANGRVDLHQASPTFHADGNQIGGASIRLDTKRDSIVNALYSCDGDLARRNLGQAFHTVQDIYSHTNAVDDNLLSILDNTGILNLVDGPDTCARTPSEIPGKSHYSTDLVSGYFPGFILFNGQCSHQQLNKDKFTASNGASHQEAVDEARGGTQNYLGLVYELLNENVDLTGEDIAFYKKILKNKQRKTILVVDSTGSMENDIVRIKNKINSYLDSLISTENKKAPTLKLITFKDESDDYIESEFMCKMSDFRTKINSLSAYGGDDCAESTLTSVYQVLQSLTSARPYTRGDIFLYTDASAHNPDLASRIINFARTNGINISFNITGDCESIKSKSANSNNKPFTNSNANIKPNHVYSYYQKISDSTGGVSFSVDKTELDQLIPVTLYMTDPQAELVVSYNISMKNLQNSESIIKVDESLSQSSIMIMVKSADGSIDMPTITLTNPLGEIITATNPNVEIASLSSIKVYIVTSPITGDWKINLSNGNSNYKIKAFAKTKFSIIDYAFLRRIEMLEESGVDVLPIYGNPSVGEELVLEIYLTQNPDALFLSFLRDDQSVIMTPEIALVQGTRGTYKAIFTVPDEFFRLKLNGSINGTQFQREIPITIKPSELLISFDTAIGNIANNIYGAQSEIKIFNLNVTNTGSSIGTYTLSVNSQQGHTVSIQEQVTIPAGQEVTLPVSVSISADAIVGSTDEIMIIAEDINNANNSNYKVARLIIRPQNLFSNGFE